MTYKSLQEIEDRYAEPANETNQDRKRRLRNRQQAITRFNQRQQRQQQAHSTTTASSTARKQKSRETLTDEQRTIIQEKNTIEHAQRRE